MKNYGMFSDAGNAVVADLIKMAKNHSLSETVVMAMMSAIAKDECFGEIEDTVDHGTKLLGILETVN